jgi:hypothetical protein
LTKPKILFVCPCWPVDCTHGGQLRALHIGRALKDVGDVSVVVVNPDATWPDAKERTAAEFRVAGEVTSMPSLPQRRNGGWSTSSQNLLTSCGS